MKTLEKIQKTCNVFKTFALIVMILSFVWAGSSVAVAVWGFIMRGAETLPSNFITETLIAAEGDPNRLIGTCLADFIFAVTDGFLLFFAFRYLKQELKDGTPFTAAGAEQIKSLGIKTIVMPLVAVIISSVIYECFEIKRLDDRGNAVSVVLGIALILFSMVLKLGAEPHEKKGK